MVLCSEINITMKNIVYDAKIAAYILNPTSKYTMDVIARDYLETDNGEYLQSQGASKEAEQTSLFETQQPQADNSKKIENSLYAEEIYKLAEITMKKLQEINKNKDVASRSMITFLVINTSSVTIIPTTTITLRMLHNSIKPLEIVPYIIITSTLSSLLGLIIDRLFYVVRHASYS